MGTYGQVRGGCKAGVNFCMEGELGFIHPRHDTPSFSRLRPGWDVACFLLHLAEILATGIAIMLR